METQNPFDETCNCSGRDHKLNRVFGVLLSVWRSVLEDAIICFVIGGLSIGTIVFGFFFRESGLPVIDFSADAAVESAIPKPVVPQENRLRFSVAPMLETKATFSVYQHLVRRVCQDIGYAPEFVLCSSYKQIRESLEEGRTQVAFVCTGTYVHSLDAKRLELLAEPVFSTPFEYRCVLLVNAANPAHAINDLGGSIMAFTDPESFTGNLLPRSLFAAERIEPETFFKKIIYTGSHDRSITAVTLSIADTAAVDALIWQAKCLEYPGLKDRIRVLWKSDLFPPPPVVIPATTDKALKSTLQNAFLNIHKSPEGRQILDGLGIDHFKIPDVEIYKAAAVYLKPPPLPGDF